MKRALKGNQGSRRTGSKSASTKVLYVEHDDNNLYMLKRRLERSGNFEVLAAEDSEQGCKLAVTEHPDVILIDLEMPVMDRWESVRTPTRFSLPSARTSRNTSTFPRAMPSRCSMPCPCCAA